MRQLDIFTVAACTTFAALFISFRAKASSLACVERSLSLCVCSPPQNPCVHCLPEPQLVFSGSGLQLLPAVPLARSACRQSMWMPAHSTAERGKVKLMRRLQGWASLQLFHCMLHILNMTLRITLCLQL